jgi:cell division cycle 14
MESSIELLPQKLYFLVSDNPPEFAPASTGSSSGKPLVISYELDDALVHSSFFADFGPLNLGKTAAFCARIDSLLRKPGGGPVIFHSPTHPHKRSNAAVLLCAYLVFVRQLSVEQAYGPFIGIQPPFIPFRDAAFSVNTFPITVLDCCRAMRKAIELNHFDIASFSVRSFFDLAKLQHGDFSWIIPGKFVAFSGPITKRRQLSEADEYSLTPPEYVPIMKSLGVTCIVRFNSKCYDRKCFVSAGINHVDMIYDDGANPPESILQGFLQLCEREHGVVAVHCKAGLGRTGTNIAAYMIKHYGYTAKEAIAWCRICRPGSVVGPQQQYLVSIEARLRAEGETFRRRNEATNGLVVAKASGGATKHSGLFRPKGKYGTGLHHTINSIF